MCRGEKTHILLRVGAHVAWQMTRLGGREEKGNRVILTVDHVCNWRGEEEGVSWNRRREKKKYLHTPPLSVLWNPSFLSGWTWQEVGKGQCPLKNDRLRSSCVRQSQREPSPTARYCRPSSSSSSSRKRVPDCGSSWWKCLVVVVVRV